MLPLHRLMERERRGVNNWPLVKRIIDWTKDDGSLFTKDILVSYFTWAFSDIYRRRQGALAFLGTFMDKLPVALTQ